MRGLMFRIMLTCINIFFPPLSVMILAGPGWDCMLNCCLFLLAVLPSHVHGFYISCTYFHRRRKVRKGRYPGPPKSLIHSDNVNNGGASNAEVAQLRQQELGLKRKGSQRSTNSGKLERESSHRRTEMAQRQGSQRLQPAQNGQLGRHLSTRTQQWVQHVSQDGYGGTQREGGYSPNAGRDAGVYRSNSRR